MKNIRWNLLRNNYRFTFLFLLVCAAALMALSGCNKSTGPTVQAGILNLRNWNFDQQGKVPINGEWNFLSEKNEEAWETMKVPGAWPLPTGKGVATYQVTLLLPPGQKDLGLFYHDISTACRIFVNGQLVEEIGTMGKDETSTVPSFHHGIVSVYPSTDTLHLKVEVANFHYRQGGLLDPIYLGTKSGLETELRQRIFLGGILIGLFFICTLIQLGIVLVERKFGINGSLALVLLFIGLHLLSLNERLLFDWMGPGSWEFTLKSELFMLFLGFWAVNLLGLNLLDLKRKRLVFGLALGVPIAAFLFTLIAPAYQVSQFELLVPFVIGFTGLFVIPVAIRAIRKGEFIGKPLLLMCAIQITMVILDRKNLTNHIGDISLVHIGFVSGIVVLFLVILIRFSRLLFEEARLSQELKLAKDELESKNVDLEKEVAEKSIELLNEKEKAHQLELDYKQKDLESAQLNIRIKQEASEQLIKRLETMDREGKGQVGIQKLIHELKLRQKLDERLDLLAKDQENVNSEFFDRLIAQYPDLSKTEREICALIRLNLSTKEIATIRQASVNSVNTARSRIRKKTGLNRKDELEQFLRRF